MMAEFGEMLAELRNDQNITQKELAGKLFVSAGTISNYENGVHFPDIEKLIALADLFHVTTDYLLGRCSVNVSPDAFEETILQGLTAGQLIRDIKSLPPEKKEALAIILNDMKLSGIISRMKQREE